MTRRMLIDGAHPEEVRVVITEGNKLLDYDVESSTKTQNKGNIYLAKVMRVEPSLQAAFVDYGGNRHGFLAFSEIHPDYYQIPIEDREALKQHAAEFEKAATAAKEHLEEIDGDGGIDLDDDMESDLDAPDDETEDADGEPTVEPEETDEAGSSPDDDRTIAADAAVESVTDDEAPTENPDVDQTDAGEGDSATAAASDDDVPTESEAEAAGTDGNDTEESGTTETRRGRGRGRRQRSGKSSSPRRYKIQEVIKRNQIILVQVVKEERGNKGAALTTYLSLAGRYCVLMPNVTRGNGGVSRKITSSTDRRRLRDLLKSLEVPDGMGVIMRTAGMERNKAEIKRDFDYLMRLWEDVRERTLESSAPALVYEEGDLVKRAIRDLYTREVEEIWVEGTEKYQAAKKLMRMMMPSHAKRVQPYKDEAMPMFHRYQVENQIEAMHNPTVQLKSGGYLVINPTEALVAIDVNSGRATRERNIEETATKTNLEAASEIAHQLKLRDLAGLIVIDFIDMEDRGNQRAVEKRFKDAVKGDRARIQVGRISNFGLLELSRQRMRPSLVENSTQPCPHCEGTGNIRSTESMTLHALRMIEEEGTRMRSSEVSITLPTRIALYLLNEKRDALNAMEAKYGFTIRVLGDDTANPTDIQLDRVKSKGGGNVEQEAKTDEQTDKAEDGGADAPRRKRSRRRRKRGQDQNADAASQENAEAEAETQADGPDQNADAPDKDGDQEGSDRPRRRRGRRGGRRRNQRGGRGRKQQADSDDQQGQAADDSRNAGDQEKGSGQTDAGSASTAETSNGSENGAGGHQNGPASGEKQANDPEPAGTADAQELPPKAPSQPGATGPDGEPKRGWWQRILE